MTRRQPGWRFWKKRIKFRGGRPASQEWNVISPATASAMASAGPFDGCGQLIDVPPASLLPCPETVKGVPIVLSSATEGSLAGQPLWPNHTVDRVMGTVFLFRRCGLSTANVVVPALPVFVGLGIRKARFDYDAVTPTWETDFDPLHEDDMEERWIWRDVVELGPAFNAPDCIGLCNGGINIDGYGSAGEGGFYANANVTEQRFMRQGIRLNVRNRCVLKENEGLVMIVSVMHTPITFAPSAHGYPDLWSEHPTRVEVIPFLRTHVKMHR